MANHQWKLFDFSSPDNQEEFKWTIIKIIVEGLDQQWKLSKSSPDNQEELKWTMKKYHQSRSSEDLECGKPVIYYAAGGAIKDDDE